VGSGIVITIDGPAGAGKSTLGRFLARQLGFRYLDSGALYRAVAWRAGRLGLDFTDTAALRAMLEDFQPKVSSDFRGFRLFIDGTEVTQELRTPGVSRDASRVATLPEVRQWVTDWLRDWADGQKVVAEGRDLGTVVFPGAQVKFYLDAALGVRAARRRQDWTSEAAAPALDNIAVHLAERDRQDESRAEAPLRVPPGAIRIDTTNLSPEEVGRQCLASIREALGSGLEEDKPSKPV
jgi:cytidylate kinase